MRTLLAGTLPLLAALALAGAEPPAPPPSMVDVLVLGDDGPVRIRLDVQIDGQPFTAAWQRYLDKLFADLDRDGDGTLRKAELGRAPTAEFLQAFLQGSLNLEAAAELVDFAALDTNHDGKIDRAELQACYRRCGFDRVRPMLMPANGDGGALTAALFRLLDTDGDGKLSAAELKLAAEVLRRIDVNGDEWITPDEVLLARMPNNEQAKAALPSFDSVGLLPVDAGQPSAEVKTRLAERYRAQRDGLPLDQPALELTIRFGKPANSAERVVARGETALVKAERRASDGSVLVTTPGLTLAVDTAPADGRVRGLHAFYRQQFEQADAAGQGNLTRAQVAELPTLAALFRLADRDGDGKLTTAELDAFLDLHALGAVSFVTLAVADRSLGLFDLLDEDRDGRLSVHELNTAWDRLRGHDRAGTGKLARTDLPRELQASFSLGKPAPRPAAKARPAAAAPKRGSAWFQKMDRNGDGYVSRREFLGPEELFDKLDTDGDGLLSPDEAERASRTD